MSKEYPPFNPDDNLVVRLAKELLFYGKHRDDCDRASDVTDEDGNHICCSCGWCLAAGAANLDIMCYEGKRIKGLEIELD